MSRPSIQEAVERSRRPDRNDALSETAGLPPDAASAPTRRKGQGGMPTRRGKINVSAYFPREVKASLRMVQAKRGGQVQELLAEALNLLFAKYGVPESATVTNSEADDE